MPTTIVSTDIILNTIASGTVDHGLDAIISAIKDRKRHHETSKMLYLNEEDTVVFNGNSNPKYLKGQKVTVRKLNRKTVVVDFPEDAWGARRFRGSKRVRVPISMVDKVN